MDLNKPLKLKPDAGEKNNSRNKKSIYEQCKGKLCLAFDFGAFSTKIVAGKYTRSGVNVEKFIRVENDDNITRVEKSNIDDWAIKLGTELKNEHVQYKGSMGFVSLSSRHYISRELEIPYSDNYIERNKRAMAELSERLSLDPSQYYADHVVLKNCDEKKQGNCTVRAVAVQQDICDSYYRLLEAMGINPLVMDINIMGFHRFLEKSHLYDRAAETYIASVDYGFRSTTIEIFKNNVFLQASSVEIGEYDLIQAIKTLVGASSIDVNNMNKLTATPEEIYQRMTSDADSQKAAGVRSFLTGWCDAVMNVINAFKLQNNSCNVECIVLRGGSEQFIWMRSYIEQYTGMKTILPEIPDDITLSKNVHTVNAPQFFNALNLFSIR